MTKGQQMAEQVLTAVRDYVAKNLQPLTDRIAELEGKTIPEVPQLEVIVAKVLEQVPAPVNGTDGKDAVLDVPAIVAEVVKQVPAPQDGKDGLPGKDAEPVDVPALIQEVVKQIPVPKDGKDFDPQLIVLEVARVLPDMVNASQDVLAERLEAAVKEIPVPKDGKDGVSISADAVLNMVQELVSKSIIQPKDGEPGRDAAQIEVLPYIDEDRAYARGTWASHKGGLVRAARTTDYLDTLKPGETIETKGWQIIYNGLHDILIDQSDERNFSLKMIQTSGLVVERKFSMPVVIDRGVYKADATYSKGDGTTWGGSFWISRKDGNTDKPGENDSWRLSIKRGRDGKDK